MKKFRKVFALLLLLLCYCKKPYTPPVIIAKNSYLVVEGIINPGNDSTIIKVSKTVNLNAAVTVNPVLDATVTVEDNQANTWPLVSNGAGAYVSPGLNLSVSQQYRLRITTNGNQYISDFVPVKLTPAIDSIGYNLTNNGVQIYVNAHDPANNTRYYRWDYNETWMFHSKYYADLVVDSVQDALVPLPYPRQIYHCWGNDASATVVLDNTSKLKEDVVYQSPITNIPFTSEKIEQEYSILVKQYALTADAFTFYQNMKKNTEQLGSIFDAQPSQLVGNIHNVADAGEPVIGFVCVSNVQSKRVFLTSAILPPNTQTIYPYDCEQDTALIGAIQGILLDRPFTFRPTVIAYDKRGNEVGVKYSTPVCVDCSLRGTITRPSFWK
jgi:hypothetical protein